MTVSTVSLLPPAPNRATMPEGTFDDVADVFVGGMEALPPDFNQSITEFNADAAVVNTKAAQVAEDRVVVAADRHATEDVYEALVGGELPPAIGTSNSAVTIGSGLKTFTASIDKLWFPGMAILARSASSATQYMAGEVVSYDQATGALTILSLAPTGAGSYSSWLIYPAGYRYRQTWAEIVTQVLGAVSAVTITGIPDIYSDLLIEFLNVGGGDSGVLQIQFSPDGSIFSAPVQLGIGPFPEGFEPTSGHIVVFNYRSAVASWLNRLAEVAADNSAVATAGSVAGGAIRMSGGISAIRFSITAGTFETGSIKLMGK